MKKDAEESLDKELDDFEREPAKRTTPVGSNQNPRFKLAEKKNSNASKISKSISSAKFTSKIQKESQKSTDDKDLSIPKNMDMINPKPIVQTAKSRQSEHKIRRPNEPSQNLPDFNDEEKKLEDIDPNQLSQDSSENLSLEENYNYQENMPRLEDNFDTKNDQKAGNIVKKSKKKKFKLK